MFLADSTKINLLLSSVPESLALLIFGVCLVGATFGLRRLLRRYDEQAKAEKDLRDERTAAKH